VTIIYKIKIYFFKINNYIFLYIVKRIFEQIDKIFLHDVKIKLKQKVIEIMCIIKKKINHFTKNISLKHAINTPQLLLIHTNNNIYSKHQTVFCAINI